MTAQRRRGLSNRSLMWIAIASLAIGVVPIVANILAQEVAHGLVMGLNIFDENNAGALP